LDQAKILPKTLEALFYMGLKFRSNMNLEKPGNKYKKLLCKNDIIFLVGFGLSFV
jgi:hypothetical protein